MTSYWHSSGQQDEAVTAENEAGAVLPWKKLYFKRLRSKIRLRVSVRAGLRDIVVLLC
jgi:hypothetical protein